MPPRRSPKSPDSSWHVPFLDALEKITSQLAKVADDPAAAATLAGASFLGGPGVAGAVIPVILLLRFAAQWKKEKSGTKKSNDLKEALEDQLRAVGMMEKGNLEDIDRLIAAKIPDTALPLLILFRDIRKNSSKLDGLGPSLAAASASLKAIRTTLSKTDVRIGNLESHLLKEFRTSHAALRKNFQIDISNLPKALRPSFEKLEKSLAVPIDEILSHTRALVEKFDLHEGAKDFRESALLDYARRIHQHYEEPEILRVRPALNPRKLSLSKLFIEPFFRQLVRPDPAALEMPAEEFYAFLRESRAIPEEELPEVYKTARASYQVHLPATATAALAAWDTPGFLLFAGAGGGKSALLRVIALRWAQAYRSAARRAKAGPVPILVELRRYATARAKDDKLTLLQFIALSLDCHARLPEVAVRAALEDGRARLFLDGLDEVPKGDARDAVIDQIHEHLHHGHRCLITSRVFGFESAKWCDRNDTTGHHMLTLDQDQQALFIRTAADQIHPTRQAADFLVARLQRRLEALPHAEEMTANPLLLTLLLLVHAAEGGAETRAELYQQAALLLMDDWEERKHDQDRPRPPQGIEILQKTTKARILHHLAWQRLTHPSKDGENLFTTRDVKDAIEAGARNLPEQTREWHKDEFPAALNSRHYIICFRGGDKYSFVHRTFLEYFAARHLAWLAETGKLAAETIYRDHIQPRLYDERWQEPLRLYLSLAAEADLPDLHRLLLAEPVAAGEPGPLVLSAEAFLDTRQEARSESLAGEIAEAAAGYLAREIVRDSSDFLEPAGIRTLDAQLSRALVRLDVFLGQQLDRWRDGSPWVGEFGGAISAAIPELARSLGKDDALRGFLLSLAGDNDGNEWGRMRAIPALADTFDPAPDLRECFREIALDAEEDIFLRSVAIRKIGEHYEPDDELFSALQKIVSGQGANNYVRGAAKDALSEWKERAGEK